MLFSMPDIIKKNEDISRHVWLRKLMASDEKKVTEWMSSAFIIHHSFVVQGPYALPADFGSIAYGRRYFSLLMADMRRITYAIMDKESHVGNVGLKDIDFDLGKADCFIEIGESGSRSKGIGTKAMQLLLDFSFDGSLFNQLNLEVLEFNRAAIGVYTKLGFEKYAIGPWHYDEFGQYWQVIAMCITKERWLSSKT